MNGPVTLAGDSGSVDLGGGVALIAPGVVGTAEVNDKPILPTTQPERLLEAASENAGFTARPPIVISHSTSASADLQISVPLPAATTGIVLLVTDESGVVSWHLPGPAADVEPAESLVAPAATQAEAAATFTIPSARFGDHPASPLTQEAFASFAPQALFHGRTLFHKIIKVLEYPIASAVGRSAAAAFGLWEQAERGANVTWFPPKQDRPKGATLTEANWRWLAEGPALLFIHGIFSDCTGCFRGLSDLGVWPRLHAKYQGRIFAYDHPTASLDPLENVKEFLHQMPPDVHLNIDIVCHSRGGLVARILAGEHREVIVGNITVDRIIFAGTPNGGTAITEPAHWDALFDRFTNLVIHVPPGPWTQTLAVTDTILQLVKYAAESGERYLPGLNCMSPGSDLYTALDAFDGKTPDYYAIDTNFVPPPILSHLFNIKADAADVGDALLDQIFGRRPNDVAVPTIGVGDPGDADVDPPPADGTPPAQPVGGFPVAAEQHYPFGPSTVWHCSYFNQQKTAEKILEWLDAPPA